MAEYVVQISCNAFAFGNRRELFDFFLHHAEFGVRSLLPGDKGVAHPHDAHDKGQ